MDDLFGTGLMDDLFGTGMMGDQYFRLIIILKFILLICFQKDILQ